MGEVSTVGIDLAKSVFQVHGSDASGTVVFRKKLRRDQVLAFFLDRGDVSWRWRHVRALTTGRGGSPRRVMTRSLSRLLTQSRS